MTEILILFLIGAGILILTCLAAGLYVLLSYGLALLLNFILPFDTFQTTLLAMLALAAIFMLSGRVLSGILEARSISNQAEEEDDDDDYEDEEDEDDDEYEDDEPVVVTRPGVPLWRQPRKAPDFSNVLPDERCPCGSGRKYKNCHGAKNVRQKG